MVSSVAIAAVESATPNEQAAYAAISPGSI